MNAENVRQEAELMAEEPSQVPDAVVEAATLEAAVLDTVDEGGIGALSDDVSSREAADDATLAGTGEAPDDAEANGAATAVEPTATAPDDGPSAEPRAAYPSAAEARAADAATPPTGTVSAERLAAKALETRLLGGERK
ncbi:MAG: hypothetical protein QOH19_878, partial [Actinomycetota bacterium]|nr:hypothetical protein [Actinomycetota bacterium]